MRLYLISALALIAILFSSCRQNPTPPAVAALLERILPENGDASRFECVLEDVPGDEYFAYSSDGSKIFVRANSISAMTAGINDYLQNQAGVNISWNENSSRLPARLPVVDEVFRKASVPLRYYLNFCTHSYTMAFWDEERWQKEIDIMALHGINMPLITEGFECVWRSLLADRYGYQDAGSFLTGPAYFGWFFMNNMTGWGGPLPDSWFENRGTLARNMFATMSELGMSPVVPGYVGMIPHDFLEKADPEKVKGWKDSDVAATGRWCGFTRPAMVTDSARLREFADAYYSVIDSLLGDVLHTRFYAIDPFHEGGAVPDGVDCGSAVNVMWDALKDHNPEAVWVAQHWQDNPKRYLTETLPLNRLIILDLHADSRGDSVCGGFAHTAARAPHQWVYGMLNNYGGNTGLFGRTNQILTSFDAAVRNASASNLVGVGAIPEGIENNTMLFDMLYSLPWCDTVPTLDEWIPKYVTMRYALSRDDHAHDVMSDAWNLLSRSILACPSPRQQGVTESVFLMRPDSVPGSVSSWANSTWYWDAADVRHAASLMLSLADTLKDNVNYQYDLVDVVAQCVADKAKEVLEAYGSASENDRRSLADRFLNLLSLQDTLRGTISSTRLDTWVDRARALGLNENESALYERNARMLITTWGDRFQCDNGGLHDYGNREWSGLLEYYYKPRWEAYFSGKRAEVDWFGDYEWPFVTDTRKASVGYSDPVDVARRAFDVLSAD